MCGRVLLFSQSNGVLLRHEQFFFVRVRNLYALRVPHFTRESFCFVCNQPQLALKPWIPITFAIYGAFSWHILLDTV
jgi:hypothetical protein